MYRVTCFTYVHVCMLSVQLVYVAVANALDAMYYVLHNPHARPKCAILYARVQKAVFSLQLYSTSSEVLLSVSTCAVCFVDQLQVRILKSFLEQVVMIFSLSIDSV